jgi:hypothetical protein
LLSANVSDELNLNQQVVAAYFIDNGALINFANKQLLDSIFSCLGDGHDGIWNLFGKIGEEPQRLETLDWYHLMENLHGVGGSFNRLECVKELLWKGKVDAAIEEFNGCQTDLALNFVAYLRKHQHRIPSHP